MVFLTISRLTQILPVIITVTISTMLDGLQEIIRANPFPGLEIRYRARNSKNGVAGPGREAKLFHSLGEDPLSPDLQGTEAFYLPRWYSAVPGKAVARVAPQLDDPGRLDPGADRCRGLPGRTEEVPGICGPQWNPEVYPIQKRASHLPPITLDLLY